MSIIQCAAKCSHQKEGYCRLEQAAAVTNAQGGCPHYLQKRKIINEKIRENK